LSIQNRAENNLRSDVNMIMTRNLFL
jgi:hypothetical protein